MANLSVWHSLTAQQLVRYEALFKLLEDIHGLQDIAAIADQVNKQWKYFANVAHWRMVLADDSAPMIIEGFRGQTVVSQVAGNQLSSWDRHHWQQQRPIIVPMANLDPEPPPPENLLGKNLHELQVIPILRGSQCFAILTATSRREPFTDIDNKYIRLLATYLADRIASILLQKRTVELLYAKATRDSLTGILNRGAILEQFEGMLEKAKHEDAPLSIILVDIDYFKVINDNYGHQTGDKVLCEVARRLQDAIRCGDHVGRYGGEEFLIVLGGCSREQVTLAAHWVHRAIGDAPFATAGIAPIEIKVTISAGTASTTGSIGYNAFGLIKQADNALYTSKAQGRNRVTFGD